MGEIFVLIPVWPYKHHVWVGFVVWASVCVVFEQCVGVVLCAYTF